MQLTVKMVKDKPLRKDSIRRESGKSAYRLRQVSNAKSQ